MDIIIARIQAAKQHILDGKAQLTTSVKTINESSYISESSVHDFKDGNPLVITTTSSSVFVPIKYDVAKKEILNREGAFTNFLNASNNSLYGVDSANNYKVLNTTNYQDLLDARVQYNLGGDGMNVFKAYMPNRTALSGDALIAYDLQFDRILQHVDNTTILDDRLAADPSLKFILAASLAEVMAQSPRLVDKILSDVNQGWWISIDNAYLPTQLGVYSKDWDNVISWKPHIKYTANIKLRMGSLLGSFIDPNDNWDLLAHEVAHSIDRFKKEGTDGIPELMPNEDIATYVQVRSEFFAAYEANNKDFSGLSEYSYSSGKPEEFWAEASMLFLSNQNSAQEIYNNSPELYDVLSRFYNKSYPIIF